MPSKGPGWYRALNQGRHQSLKKVRVTWKRGRKGESEPREADRTPALTVLGTQVFSNVPCQLKCPRGTKVSHCPATCLLLHLTAIAVAAAAASVTSTKVQAQKCIVNSHAHRFQDSHCFTYGHYLCQETVKTSRAPPLLGSYSEQVFRSWYWIWDSSF